MRCVLGVLLKGEAWEEATVTLSDACLLGLGSLQFSQQFKELEEYHSRSR